MRIDKLTPAETSVVERHNEGLCGCYVGSERNVINVAKTEQGGFVIVDLLSGISAS